MVQRNDTIVTNSLHDISDQNFTCPVRNQATSHISTEQATTQNFGNSNSTKFDWSETEIGNVQGIYYLGYVSSMMVGTNFLIQGVGFFTGMLILLVGSTAACLLFPLITELLGLPGALVMRFLLGISHGQGIVLFL